MSIAISSARMFLDEIKSQSDAFLYLSSLADPNGPQYPFFEQEWIDFKGQPRDDKDAKEIWSKALSGYANITDGLIVWGIDARKQAPRDIDAACGKRLIQNPLLFESKLRQWVRDATNPPVMGVEFQTYPGPDGEGFVVCLVPESSHKPHRAEFAGKHYYYRASDNFLMAEPGLLRTLFYPRSSPNLWVEVVLKYSVEPRDQWERYQQDYTNQGFNDLINRGHALMEYDVRLHNSGAATAKDVYVVVQTDDKIIFHPDGRDWQSTSNPQGNIAFKGMRPLHPGTVSTLFQSEFQSKFKLQQQGGSTHFVPYFGKATLRILMYAEASERQKALIEFTPKDFAQRQTSAVKRGTVID